MGPKWKFEDPAALQRAVEICRKNVPKDSWRVTDDNTITFASIKAEELYAIATSVSSANSGAVTSSQEAVAGSGKVEDSQAGRSRWT
jgi:hypothetical protein